ncbi:calcitonin gene-related peptide type 1 receptor-like [Mercenaria mercenaria]|uniref:calcitonin gene-related peptide type 1 receptor-like n=1 Tax=Mercenaria mercenaria TaxID=6596 RepID=UPI00234E8308|nr:calcitonin gene-related peptide type 1 receptor-like [Mercenaria mercenaria]
MSKTTPFIRFILFILQVYLTIVQSVKRNNTEEINEISNSVCRDRLGYFNTKDFKLSTCSLCYFYLVVENPEFVLNREISVKQFHTEPFLLLRNTSNTERNLEIHPAFDNQTSINIVCDTLDDVTCNGWVTCCRGAWDCCQKQINRKLPTDDGQYCPQTFDGWDCWDGTPSNQTVTQSCPTFLSPAEGARSSKTCGVNGKWQTDSNTDLEYTVYDDCSSRDKKQVFRVPIIVGMVLNVAGMVLLIPSITIFLIYRNLRRQHRIKIHLNFFLSILLASVFCLIWDVVVRLDRLANEREESFLLKQQSLCKCLHVLHRFARASIFFWMSCEGFFLHRLLVNAFSPPKHFLGYLIYAWGVPIILCCVYAVIRKQIADDSLCWILPLEGEKIALDWILVYTPTIACISINVLFLFNILKLLVRKATKHPNEPSNFRKILKATFILVPLFGIHQFCLIYRPSPDAGVGYDVYEIVSAIFLNSQGIVVSLLFCYFNKEVQSSVKISFKRLGRRYSHRRSSDGRKLSMSVSNTSRRTSVSSIQTGGIATLYGHGSAKNKPFNENGIKLYGKENAKEAELNSSEDNSKVRDSDNKCQPGVTHIALYSNGYTNGGYLPEETFQESVRL